MVFLFRPPPKAPPGFNHHIVSAFPPSMFSARKCNFGFHSHKQTLPLIILSSFTSSLHTGLPRPQRLGQPPGQTRPPRGSAIWSISTTFTPHTHRTIPRCWRRHRLFPYCRNWPLGRRGWWIGFALSRSRDAVWWVTVDGCRSRC